MLVDVRIGNFKMIDALNRKSIENYLPINTQIDITLR